MSYLLRQRHCSCSHRQKSCYKVNGRQHERHERGSESDVVRTLEAEDAEVDVQDHEDVAASDAGTDSRGESVVDQPKVITETRVRETDVPNLKSSYLEESVKEYETTPQHQTQVDEHQFVDDDRRAHHNYQTPQGDHPPRPARILEDQLEGGHDVADEDREHERAETQEPGHVFRTSARDATENPAEDFGLPGAGLHQIQLLAESSQTRRHRHEEH